MTYLKQTYNLKQNLKISMNWGIQSLGIYQQDPILIKMIWFGCSEKKEDCR